MIAADKLPDIRFISVFPVLTLWKIFGWGCSRRSGVAPFRIFFALARWQQSTFHDSRVAPKFCDWPHRWSRV